MTDATEDLDAVTATVIANEMRDSQDRDYSDTTRICSAINANTVALCAVVRAIECLAVK